MTDTLPKGPVAYLTGEYPKVSHTFIEREIGALRSLGVTVETYTMRRAAEKDVVGPTQKEEERNTWPVLRNAMQPLRLIGSHLALLRQAPGRWWEALKLARRTCPPGMKEAMWQVFYFFEAGVLAKRLQDRGVVHLHNHFANSSCTVAMLTSVMSGIPYSFTMHGPAIFFEPMKWRIDEKIARAAFVACISHFCRGQGMMFSDSAHWPRLKIVHCGIEPEKYGHVDRSNPGKRLIFVGRLAPVKGGSVLLDGFARALEAHPDAHLTIVGDGPDKARLEAQAKALNMGNSVEFTGYLDSAQVAERLDRADILVLPSFAEGVPVVLMEAMAARMPVIGPKVAGVEELIEEGVSGHVIPPGDVETLAARINDLFADSARRAEMGIAGRAKVEADFNGMTEAARLAALFADPESWTSATPRPPLSS
ncbi:MAG: glycosyltransferase family 4 protein [Pseudomonadota bacterium]|nr:glycosyltransferase family 4 protein [Pseudomonadota bacterium]